MGCPCPRALWQWGPAHGTLVDVYPLTVSACKIQALCRPVGNKGITECLMCQDFPSEELLASEAALVLWEAAGAFEGIRNEPTVGPRSSSQPRCSQHEALTGCSLWQGVGLLGHGRTGATGRGGEKRGPHSLSAELVGRACPPHPARFFVPSTNRAACICRRETFPVSPPNSVTPGQC